MTQLNDHRIDYMDDPNTHKLSPKSKQCSWWRGHDWEPSGYNGVLTIRETCTRCGWHKVFNGALNEEYYIAPERTP